MTKLKASKADIMHLIQIYPDGCSQIDFKIHYYFLPPNSGAVSASLIRASAM